MYTAISSWKSFSSSASFSPCRRARQVLRRLVLSIKAVTGAGELCFLLLLTSCASTPDDPRIRKAEPPQSVSVGVRKFDYPVEEEMEENDVVIREFESYFLPAMLASVLKREPDIHEALYVESDTHALDVLIEGTITESNGRDLAIDLRVSQVGGDMWKESSYDLKHPEEEPHDEMVELENLYLDVREDVRKQWKGLKYDLNDFRAVAYAADADVPLTPEVLEAARQAAEVEREVILLPLSNVVTDRAVVAARSYFAWQDLSKGLVYEQARAKRGKFFSAVTSGVMGATAIASLAMGYEAAGQGNAQAVRLAQQNTQLASNQMVAHATNMEVQQNRLDNIQQSLDEYKQTFGEQGAEPVTVSIYGKVLELKGSQSEKLREFRRTVAEHLRAIPAEDAVMVKNKK